MAARLNATTLLLLLLASACAWQGGRRGGKSGGGAAKRAEQPAQSQYEVVECKKCMSTVMRLLVPAPRGCPEGNGSFVASSTASRVPSAFCDAALPKKRQCIVYSFGTGGVWDFDNVRAR